MTQSAAASPYRLHQDLVAGVVVFLVALPLCLGIALASGAPLFSGIVAGILGGLMVGLLSGSHTSVSGPAAGLTAVVALEIERLGSFEAFLFVVTVAGALQIVLGLLRAGNLSAFFPTSVIHGLLSAIGVILILKQIPHLLGRDADPTGSLTFLQPDKRNTFTELLHLWGEIHEGAIVVGLISLGLMIVSQWKPLKGSLVPMPLVVVLAGAGLKLWFDRLGGEWLIQSSHLVQVPVAGSVREFVGFLAFPDFTQWTNPAAYMAAITVAIVASLETLLNLEAVDKLDPQRRQSPPNRELLAQGAGNVTAGLCGGLPMTSVIVRSSVNVLAGGRTKLATVIHGGLLLVCVALFPTQLNHIPLSCLAAILLYTGYKLANPDLFRKMWSQGRYQFAPFVITMAAIVLTDLLTGVLIGLGVSLTFILHSNLRRPIQRVVEKHASGEVVHLQLANQVSFLNRASLSQTLRNTPPGSHLLIDAVHSDYIDPDILSLVREYKQEIAPAFGVEVSLRGFRSSYQLEDEIRYVDYSTRELQSKSSPAQVLRFLHEGNERFRTGRHLEYDFRRQRHAAAHGQHPLAVVLSCVDSRMPAEIVFDLGLGDIFCIRIAGNIVGPKILGSMEYGCSVAGAKVVLAIGHTQCGAVSSSVQLAAATARGEPIDPLLASCNHLGEVVEEINHSIAGRIDDFHRRSGDRERAAFVDQVARRNVQRTVAEIYARSRTLRGLVDADRIAIVGAMYDVTTGHIEFLLPDSYGSNLLEDLADVVAKSPVVGGP
ncbi:MAG: bifunctional SulP family inorganic anion transporter/carbonic anhydrase [Pirellulales bacterium]|nr:bifunctional SulP family inorganic anion transporter/carbonic anhydrase [Pirellulales bacterium]